MNARGRVLNRRCHYRPAAPVTGEQPDPQEQALALAMAMRTDRIDVGNQILAEIRDPYAVLLMMTMMANLAASDDEMASFGRDGFWYPPSNG